MRTKFSILGLRLIFNFGCMVFDGIWVTTKFHFFIGISIEFPILDMCFPTFRDFYNCAYIALRIRRRRHLEFCGNSTLFMMALDHRGGFVLVALSLSYHDISLHL